MKFRGSLKQFKISYQKNDASLNCYRFVSIFVFSLFLNQCSIAIGFFLFRSPNSCWWNLKTSNNHYLINATQNGDSSIRNFTEDSLSLFSVLQSSLPEATGSSSSRSRFVLFRDNRRAIVHWNPLRTRSFVIFVTSRPPAFFLQRKKKRKKKSCTRVYRPRVYRQAHVRFVNATRYCPMDAFSYYRRDVSQRSSLQFKTILK